MARSLWKEEKEKVSPNVKHKLSGCEMEIKTEK
jgi:hypothetical protein